MSSITINKQAKRGCVLSDEDRARLHKLLDYALDHDESFVIAQYARMDLDFHVHRTIYKMNIIKDEENETWN